MFSRKRIFANFGSFLILALPTMLSAGLASAQTSSAEKQKFETDSTKESPAALSNKPVAIKIESESKPAANRIEAEAALMNAKGEEPKNGTAPIPALQYAPAPCRRTINADVVALPQPIMLNRLGAAIPDGLVFALRSDTVAAVSQGKTQLQLKNDKRPRPLVLRANVGDCLKINLTNAITTEKFTNTTVPGATTGTTEVSLHIQ